MMKPLYILTILSSILLTSCRMETLPADFEDRSESPLITPDYKDVTVPVNIAPLNFMIRDADKVLAEFCWNGGTKVYGKRNKVQIPLKEWREILSASVGNKVKVSIYTETDGKWNRWQEFSFDVVPDKIDKYLSYRLIEPSYVSYEELRIVQRDVESFDETTFFSTIPGRKKGVDQCINCHSYQNYNTDNMLFHIRGNQGGTMFIRNGESQLLSGLKRDDMISNPVYPAWHPADPVIAFSTNNTLQIFHTHDNAKVEVMDTESHLVLYDVENDRMIPVESDDSDMETFPAWSADGTKLYYCSARYQQQNMNVTYERDMMTNYKDIHYGIFVRDYDRVSRTFGPRRTVLDYSDESASLPRVSPDGRFLVFAHGAYGCFHIWHQDSDIYMLDLQNGTVDRMPDANSSRAESYPSWASTGRWISMESRRDDGNYTRVYMAYVGTDGKARKAFELPQKDPETYDRLLKSFNRPEFTINKLPKIQ